MSLVLLARSCSFLHTGTHLELKVHPEAVYCGSSVLMLGDRELHFKKSSYTLAAAQLLDSSGISGGPVSTFQGSSSWTFNCMVESRGFKTPPSQATLQTQVIKPTRQDPGLCAL